MRKERNCRYGNENTAPRAVGSTLVGEGQIRKEVLLWSSFFVTLRAKKILL